MHRLGKRCRPEIIRSMDKDEHVAAEVKLTTEARIREAARTVFREKGFAATTTRDIASAAGVNPALINYYFKGKRNLFNMIMNETLSEFDKELEACLADDADPLLGLTRLVDRLMNLYAGEPDLVLFMFDEMRKGKSLADRIESKRQEMSGSQFGRLLSDRCGHDPDMDNALIDIISLTLFPFVGKPVIQAVFGLDEDGFARLLDQRRRRIPEWIGRSFGDLRRSAEGRNGGLAAGSEGGQNILEEKEND